MATTKTGALGADTITGGTGADTLAGGLGNDIYIVNSLLNVIVEPAPVSSAPSISYPGMYPSSSNYAYSAAYGGVDTIQTSVLDKLKTYSLEKSPYVENLSYTGSIAAQLKGNAGDNIIKANAATLANDTLYGGDGNDALYGYGGKDLLQGGNGNDTLDGGVGADADTLIGGAGNDTYLNVTASESIIETRDAGFDTISTASSGKYLDLRQFANLEGIVYNSTVGATLHGNGAGNLLSATAASGNDTINGWAGNDTINGGGGNDALIGGDGDDDLAGGAGTDSLTGGNGNDVLDGGAGTDALTGGSGDDIYYAEAADVVTEAAGGGIDTLIGAKTTIAGTEIENLVYTSATSAKIYGNNVDNVIAGGVGNDIISADNGNDTVIGGAGRDSLQGGSGDDALYGGTFSNVQARGFLYEEMNNGVKPVLVDDNAIDTLVGGAGGDTYLIDNDLDVVTELAVDTGMDVIHSTIDNSLTTYGNVEALVLDDNLSNSAAWFAEGNGGANILVGNNNENYLSGGIGNDTLTGDSDGSGSGSGGYYDQYGYYHSSSSVTDVVDGGAGNDVLLALGRETVSSIWNSETQSYVSTINGYTSNVSNVLLGGEGNDFYLIQNANTAIDDSAGVDTVYLMGAGTPESIDGVERIVLAGGSAADDAIALAAINKVRLANGDNNVMTAVPTAAALNATGNALGNTIIGNSNNNYLSGLDGNDTLTGGNGNDTLVGGAGKDMLVGGTGNDVYEADTGDVVTELANGGNDLIRSATLTSFAAYANIEGLEYTGTSNVKLENGSSNVTEETFIGGAGKDTINGWGGDDDLSGGAGNDSLNGGDGNDYLQGGAGADTVMGGLGNDTIFGFDDSTQTYSPTPAVDLANKLYGGAGNDKITSGNGADLLYGEDGNDTLSGGLGADTIDGGAGNDMLYAATPLYSYDYYGNDLSANALSGGAGNDTLYGSTGKDTLAGGTENDYVYGGSGNDLLSGDAGADDLWGGDGNDTLNGGADNDQLNGNWGNDSLSGNDGDDFLRGNEGDDILTGGAGNDNIEGGSGDDILYAGLATAAIYGTSGDRLIGDFSYNGSNQLTGKDIFRFEESAAFAGQSVNDTGAGGTWNGTAWIYPQKYTFSTGHFIDDFTVGEDKIQFTKAMVGDGDAVLENVALKTVAGGTFAKAAEMVIVQADLTSDFNSMYAGSWNAVNASEVVAAIGSADAAYAKGDERLFVVDDGYSSALFQFVSAGADATVSASELKLIGIVDGQAALATSDFGLY